MTVVLAAVALVSPATIAFRDLVSRASRSNEAPARVTVASGTVTETAVTQSWVRRVRPVSSASMRTPYWAGVEAYSVPNSAILSASASGP
ncbi:hypothetical protein ACFW80_35250 [Streptomyces fimicarius]|uniref:hypothetical protein n=1 Tax=Streptomyces griseus TaxID=1911 RepID=UPI0036BDD2EF